MTICCVAVFSYVAFWVVHNKTKTLQHKSEISQPININKNVAD